MRFNKWLAAVVMVAGLVFSPLGNLVWAHHSIAGYDSTKEVALHGVIKEFNWRNPHVYVVWDVKDASGKVTEWAGELSAPTTMLQAGMHKDSLKVGDEVIMTVNPSKTGSPLGIIKKINREDGTLVLDRQNRNGGGNGTGTN